MYCRTFLVFSSFLAFYAQSNWEQNNFDVKVIAKNVNSSGEANGHYVSDGINLGLSLNTVNLFNGWGVSAGHTSSYSTSRSSINTSHHDRKTNLTFKLFVKENVDFDVNLNQQSLLNSNGITLTNFLNESRNQFISSSNNALVNMNIGNDQSYWNVKVSTNISELNFEDINTKIVFKEHRDFSTNISFSWKVSEDSFFTAKYGSQDNNSLQSNTSYKTSIIDSYLGFKTRYLGTSKLSVDLGSSNVSGSNNSLSWKLTHETNINDYFKARFSSGRKFSLANDFRLNADLNTYNTFNISFIPSNYYSVNLAVDLKDGLISDTVTTNTTLINAALNLNYLTNWSSRAFIEKSEYKDDRKLFNYEQTQIGFQISRDLI